jgi:hypothetical protein
LPSFSRFEARIRGCGKLRLGDPSKNRYSVWKGFVGSANFAASAFAPSQCERLDRWKVAEATEQGQAT